MSEERKRVTVATLKAFRQRQQKVTMLTAYDYTFAVLLDQAGIDVVLVGDSLGMVVQGEETTLPVTVDEMVYHTRLVRRGLKRALLVADLPFMSYSSQELALQNAGRLMKEAGAQMVKLEGGEDQIDTVATLTCHNIPVCAHLGLQPQSVHRLGGYRVQGRETVDAEQMVIDARRLEQAGASMLVLESIPERLANEIAAVLEIPVIGIGAGAGCDGQVLVLYDLLGITPGHRPRFARNFMAGALSIENAIERYIAAVKDGSFPAQEEIFL